MSDKVIGRLMNVVKVLNVLQIQAGQLRDQMNELKQQGMVNATVHIRSDNGGVELLHKRGSQYEDKHGRVREYIGKKEGKVQEAMGRIERFTQYEKLGQGLRRKEIEITKILNRIDSLEDAALAAQT